MATVIDRRYILIGDRSMRSLPERTISKADPEVGQAARHTLRWQYVMRRTCHRPARLTADEHRWTQMEHRSKAVSEKSPPNPASAACEQSGDCHQAGWQHIREPGSPAGCPTHVGRQECRPSRRKTGSARRTRTRTTTRTISKADPEVGQVVRHTLRWQLVAERQKAK